MRRVLVKIHRWLGLGCGLVFFLVCITGSLLVFEDEISAYLNRSLLQETEAPVSLDVVLASAQSRLVPGEWIQRIYIPPGRVRTRGPLGKRNLYFSPVDGTYLGEGDKTMSFVLNFHRNLLLSDVGRWVTLVSCISVIITLLSGLKLWLPNQLRRVRQALTIKRDGSRRRFILDVHRVFGVLVVLPLLLIAVTGLNYSKASDPLRQALFTALFEKPIPAADQVEPSQAEPLPLDTLVKLAQEVYPEAELSCVELTEDPEAAVKVRLRHPGQPGDFGQSNVMLHPRTGATLRTLNALELPPGQQFVYVWALPLHRGDAFGTAQKILWLIIVLCGALLPLTGFWLWYGRGKNRKDGSETAQ